MCASLHPLVVPKVYNSASLKARDMSICDVNVQFRDGNYTESIKGVLLMNLFKDWAKTKMYTKLEAIKYIEKLGGVDNGIYSTVKMLTPCLDSDVVRIIIVDTLI